MLYKTNDIESTTGTGSVSVLNKIKGVFVHLDEGPFKVEYPANLSEQSKEEIIAYLEVIKKGLNVVEISKQELDRIKTPLYDDWVPNSAKYGPKNPKTRYGMPTNTFESLPLSQQKKIALECHQKYREGYKTTKKNKELFSLNSEIQKIANKKESKS